MNTETISTANEQFWAMSKQEQAIAIAKDVIENLDRKFIQAKKGKYFEIEKTNIREPNKGEKLDAYLESIQREGVQCTVCAIGAAFVSAVRLGDRIEGHVTHKNYTLGRLLISDSHMRWLLRTIFPSHQLASIETAFEKEKYTDDGYAVLPENDVDDAVEFGRQHTYDDDARLRAIFQNIIDNNGVFIPEIKKQTTNEEAIS